MKLPRIMHNTTLALSTAAGFTLMAASGCQTSIGGQSLPSAYYLTDDVQFYPAGPEDKIFNERRALEQYKAGVQPSPTPLAQPQGGPPAPGP